MGEMLQWVGGTHGLGWVAAVGGCWWVIGKGEPIGGVGFVLAQWVGVGEG